MIVINNCLPEHVADIVSEGFNNTLNDNIGWSINENFWPPSLLNSVVGVVSQRIVVGDILYRLKQALSSHLPKHNDAKYQYYNWHKMSGIALHEDHGYSFGATLYLNKKWDPNWGGVFIWGEDSNNLTNAIIPQYNTLVINTPPMKSHLVTTISPLAPESRKTIQIWGDDTE